MGDLTISARVVADGVGLPPMWMDVRGGPCRLQGPDRLVLEGDGWVCPIEQAADLSLTDPQTAFGVALQLDGWERAGGGVGGWAQQWAQVAHREPYSLGEGHVSDERAREVSRLVGRVEHIGLDHRTRRALDGEPEPGTLAALAVRRGVWGMEVPRGWSHAFPTDGPGGVYTTPVPALAGITDPLEALRAIAEEVAPEM